MQHQPAGGAGYQDPLIAIRDGALAIRRYYFPTGTKRIRLAAITRAELAGGRGGPGPVRAR